MVDLWYMVGGRDPVGILIFEDRSLAWEPVLVCRPKPEQLMEAASTDLVAQE